MTTAIQRNIRDEMFVNMERLPIKFFDTRPNGEIMSCYTNDADTLRELLANGVPYLISNGLTVLGIFVVMLVMSPLLTLFVIAMIAIMFVIVKFIGGRSGKHFVGQQKAISVLDGYVESEESAQIEAGAIECGLLRDAEKLQRGQRAGIWSQGVQQTMATVERIGAAVTDTATGQVTCEVVFSLDQALDLPLGAQVEAEVELLKAENVTVVPLQALSQTGSVWWIADGRAWETDAAVVAQDEVSAWVALPEGVSVVVSSAKELAQGQRVKEMTP